jgi:hypothetical protein
MNTTLLLRAQDKAEDALLAGVAITFATRNE